MKLSRKPATRMGLYNSWDFSDRPGAGKPLSERIADTYDWLGIVGANWHPGEVAQLEAENQALLRVARAAEEVMRWTDESGPGWDELIEALKKVEHLL